MARRKISHPYNAVEYNKWYIEYRTRRKVYKGSKEILDLGLKLLFSKSIIKDDVHGRINTREQKEIKD